MHDRLLQVRGWLDLDLLEAERKGNAPIPPERKASESARNDAAVRDKFFNIQVESGPAYEPSVGDYPQVVHSVEEHLKSKGLSTGQISEKLLDLAKHEHEENKPGPDLTYFSEWEYCVGLHHAIDPPATIVKAPAPRLTAKQMAEFQLSATNEMVAVVGFLIDTRVRLHGNPPYKRLTKIPENELGTVRSSPVLCRTTTRPIQCVRWDQSGEIWEMCDWLEPASDCKARHP